MFSLNIPDYDDAAIQVIHEVINGFMNVDPLFAGVEKNFTNHQGPVRNVRGETPLDQNMDTIHGESSLSWDSIRNSNLDDYVIFLFKLSESQRKGLARFFFKNITEITDATGNTINAMGKPLTYDMILDLFEKIEIGFDDTGKPLFPTLVMPPQMIEGLKKIKPTPKQIQREKQIIEEKRAIFNAKKHTRRLS